MNSQRLCYVFKWFVDDFILSFFQFFSFFLRIYWEVTSIFSVVEVNLNYE